MEVRFDVNFEKNYRMMDFDLNFDSSLGFGFDFEKNWVGLRWNFDLNRDYLWN